MKLIFSRKGFDAGIGGGASPILFPTNALWSLPVPLGFSKSRYCDIMRGGQSLASLVEGLTGGRIHSQRRAHLDPDLCSEDIPRLPGWKPIFGQSHAAERHLQNKGVQAGDIFLFYGWFKQVEYANGIHRYVVNVRSLHVIFGWLQVEQRISVPDEVAIPPWALYHPHCLSHIPTGGLNSLYISSNRLSLPDIPIDLPGAGLFSYYDPLLCLTAEDMSRSFWRLPTWLYPDANRSGLSYHQNLERWQRQVKGTLLKTVGRGQEFVLDCQMYPEVIEWLASIFQIAKPLRAKA